MRTRILALFVVCLTVEAIQAQSKFHVALDYYYNLGLSEQFVGRHYGRGDYEMSGNSLRLSANYDFVPAWSAGAGVGMDRYTEPSFNTMPIFATLQYAPLKKARNAYVFSDLGYAIKISDDFHPGFTGKLGIGYKLILAKHFGLNFRIAYDFKDFRKIRTTYFDEASQQGVSYDSNSKRHSVSFGVGMTF